MAEVKLPPSDIYFSQDSISNRFGKCTPHRFKFIGETLDHVDDILQGKCEVYDIPPISVINKEGVWVTADNRRLWVFKKLQQFGECDEINVTITSELNPKKDRVLPTITVRGPAGGTLWVKHEASKRREVTSSWHKHLSHFSIPFSLGSLSLTDRPDVRPLSDVSSVESLCSLSALKESSDRSSNGKDRSSNYSVTTAYSNPKTGHISNKSGIYSASKHTSLSQREVQTCVSDYNFSTVDSPKQRTPYRSYRSQEHTPTSLRDSVYTRYGYKLSHSFGNENSSRASEKENTRSLTIERRDKVVRLKPLDVGFAGDTGLFLAFDGNLYGEMMDKWCENLTKSWHVSMDVFMHKGKYYSVENEKLWKSQTLERFSSNIIISGRVVPKPFIYYPIYGLHSFLISTDKISGGKWKNFVTLNGLPTKRSIKLDLSEILYTSTIQDTYQGKSIAGKLVELFTSGKRSHEVNVMEYENKYYTLENKKLWVLKHAEKVLGKFTITGHVKISMDYIMFHSFMTEGPCVGEVDVNLSRNHTHTAEEKFILTYIHQIEKRVD